MEEKEVQQLKEQMTLYAIKRAIREYEKGESDFLSTCGTILRALRQAGVNIRDYA